jgi:hypothetical protein
MANIESGQTCAACGRKLPAQQGRGRLRQYCNATCRSVARRERNAVDRRATGIVNAKLTLHQRHDNLDVMQGTAEVPDPAGPAESAVANRLAAELAQPGGEVPLAAIAAARRLSAAADVALQEAVDRARAAGHSWREIGDVLDTTRQAAFQRFGRPVDPRTGTPMSRAVLPGAADKAVTIFADMAASRWEEARRDFAETMQERLDADRLADGWARTIGMIGNFERMGEPLTYPAGESTVVDIPLHFEAGDRTGRVSFDSDVKVIGLFIRPASA